MSLCFLTNFLKMSAIIVVRKCIENLNSRVLFEKRKLDLSIFTFDEQINDQTSKKIIKELPIDQNFENLFEDELICLDESIRGAVVGYTTLEKIVDQSFEVMFEDELKFLVIHVVDVPIEMCNDN